MDDTENQRINEEEIKDSNLIEIDALFEVCASICRISTSTGIGTGFFIKLRKKIILFLAY